MAFAQPDALIFDVFGTCVDWRSSVAACVREAVAAVGAEVDPVDFAVAWRARYQPAMQAIRSGKRSYTELDILHRENLDATLEEFGLAELFGEDARGGLNRAWEKLVPWPDTVPGLNRLKLRYMIAPCSNGSIAMMTRLAKFGGMPWDCILGAGLARAYKPIPEAYLRSCAALQLPPSKVMMVAAHNDDLRAARAAELPCLFVPRPTEHGPDQKTDLAPDADWEIVASDMEDAAGKLLA